MRTVTKLFFEYFGIKYFAFIPLFLIAVFLIFNKGGFPVSELMLPLDIGIFVAMVFLGFGSYRNLILLGRSLPVDPGRLAAALQLSYYVMLVATFLPVILLAILRDIFAQDALIAYPGTIQVFLNVVAMWILISLTLPFLLTGNKRKPKIIVACLTIPFPGLIGGGLQTIADRQPAIDPAFLWLTTAMLFLLGIIATLFCYRLSGSRLKVFEA